MDSQKILDREFLELRSKLLDIAASLDRIDRAPGDIAADDRMRRLSRGIEILASDRPDRASSIQQLFSRQYDQQWKQKFNLPSQNQ
jgi:hypothetical protein